MCTLFSLSRTVPAGTSSKSDSALPMCIAARSVQRTSWRRRRSRRRTGNVRTHGPAGRLDQQRRIPIRWRGGTKHGIRCRMGCPFWDSGTAARFGVRCLARLCGVPMCTRPPWMRVSAPMCWRQASLPVVSDASRRSRHVFGETGEFGVESSGWFRAARRRSSAAWSSRCAAPAPSRALRAGRRSAYVNLIWYRGIVAAIAPRARRGVPSIAGEALRRHRHQTGRRRW